jgi:hypothetical protein
VRELVPERVLASAKESKVTVNDKLSEYGAFLDVAVISLRVGHLLVDGVSRRGLHRRLPSRQGLV